MSQSKELYEREANVETKEKEECLHVFKPQKGDDLELKPCPFCGGKAEVNYGCWDYNCYLVECKSCAGTVIDARWDSPEEAIEAWNRRV